MNKKVRVRAAADLINRPALQALLKDLADQFDYLMLASTEDRLFERFDLSRAQDLNTWPMGQAFGPKSELRWRPKDDRFAVCFVTEADALPSPLSEMREREELEADQEELQVRLWGEHTDDDVNADGQPFWFEAQIPRLLTYPVADTVPPVVALRVVRYLRDDGTVAFVRFVKLEGWSRG